MTDEPKQLPEKYSDTTRYRLLKSGGVYDMQTKRIVDNLGGEYTLTPATGRELSQIKHEQGVRHARIGDIRGAGIEISSDAPEDELENKRLAAIETYHEKRGSLLMDAKSARGIEGLFPGIDKSLMEPPSDIVHTPDGDMPVSLLVQIRQYVLQLGQGGGVVDAETITGEISPGHGERE